MRQTTISHGVAKPSIEMTIGNEPQIRYAVRPRVSPRATFLLAGVWEVSTPLTYAMALAPTDVRAKKDPSTRPGSFEGFELANYNG